MEMIILLGVLTNLVLLIILFKRPSAPTILRFEPISLLVKGLEPAERPETPAPVPMPANVFDYCEQESEEHARVARRGRARRLFGELGDWTAVLEMLKREDRLQ